MDGTFTNTPPSHATLANCSNCCCFLHCYNRVRLQLASTDCCTIFYSLLVFCVCRCCCILRGQSGSPAVAVDFVFPIFFFFLSVWCCVVCSPLTGVRLGDGDESHGRRPDLRRIRRRESVRLLRRLPTQVRDRACKLPACLPDDQVGGTGLFCRKV